MALHTYEKIFEVPETFKNTAHLVDHVELSIADSNAPKTIWAMVVPTEGHSGTDTESLSLCQRISCSSPPASCCQMS